MFSASHIDRYFNFFYVIQSICFYIRFFLILCPVNVGRTKKFSMRNPLCFCYIKIYSNYVPLLRWLFFYKNNKPYAVHRMSITNRINGMKMCCEKQLKWCLHFLFVSRDCGWGREWDRWRNINICTIKNKANYSVVVYPSLVCFSLLYFSSFIYNIYIFA